MAAATAIAVGGLAVSAYGAAKSADTQRKSLHAQQDQLKAQANGMGALEQSTADLSKQNAQASADLERQLTPEVTQLRQQSNQALLSGMNDGSYDMSRAKGLLNGQMGQQLNTPLLQAAIAKAQGDLALGGTLSQDSQNLATRKALATAGTVGGGGLGLGRDLVARDLGLTSMQVEQQRLQNASQLGGQELQLGQSNAGNLLNQIGLLNQINQGDFGRRLATAQYAEGIQRPIVGLDPGSAANLQIANQNAQGAAAANAANIKGQQQQGYMNLAGQIGGALLSYNNRPQQPVVQPVQQSQLPAVQWQPVSYTPSYTPSTSGLDGYNFVM